MIDHVFYDGPSVMTGDRIMGIVTGLGHNRSKNPKTGQMAQVWILRADMPPMEAKRQNLDDAICGDCALRGDRGFGAVCYVTVWFGPNHVWKAWRRGKYPVTSVGGGRPVLRITAYGDAAALPFDAWPALLADARGWIGYTHQWRTCDPRFRGLLMASVDNAAERSAAAALGWRTFRARGQQDPVLRDEFICPASNESGHRVTCLDCQLCGGLSTPARSVAIIAHGKPGNVAAFYRSRSAMMATIRHERSGDPATG